MATEFKINGKELLAKIEELIGILFCLISS